ncbi:hypothetical protein HYH03_001072 [Edaphochlamys debaryana]|uniref:Uncharacterized protein n=1 Tax=Edaphochlamys debaryana TaxID=47281 RepID=A0A836C5J2_9CHLO|nr:hypothetical protein HYH03_001072 [Edaphochlamys debaryana]|eukprot:KAG2501266.1 hypothetical protein HYH03_001072 [Edaphochlamys debaryana]
MSAWITLAVTPPEDTCRTRRRRRGSRRRPQQPALTSLGTKTVETLDRRSASRPAALAAAEPQLMPGGVITEAAMSGGGEGSGAKREERLLHVCTAALPDRQATSTREPAVSRLLSAAGALVASVALLCSPLAPPPAHASNVRLEDVESPQLKAGLEAATSGDYATAEEVFSRLLVADPTQASVWSNLGNVHMSLGRPQQAFEDYTHAVELAPYAPVPYLNRAIALEELGVQLSAQGQQAEAGRRWGEALADCDAAIERDRQEFAAWFNKGNVQLRLGEYDNALASYSAAADLAPGIAGYRLRAGQLQWQCGQADAAVRTVKGVLRKSPRYAEAHLSLAAMLWASGQEAAAEGQLEAAQELGGRWRDSDWVEANTRWPPALREALERLLALESAAAEGGAAGQQGA